LNLTSCLSATLSPDIHVVFPATILVNYSIKPLPRTAAKRNSEYRPGDLEFRGLLLI
jgi:hypothetical protein